MAYTTTELADAVLREMAVVDASETPDAADRTYVTDTYAALWEELAAPGYELAYWPPADIPNQVFLVIRDLMILECQGAFGRPLPPAEKDARRQVIEKRLRRLVGVRKSGLPTKAIYF